MKIKIKTFVTSLSQLPKKWVKFIALSLVVFLTSLSFVVFTPSPATASQVVVLTYGPQRIAIPMSELVQFGETGEASRVIRFLTGIADVDRDLFRTVLTQEIPANLRVLDRTLNFIVGELFLYEISQAIYPPSRRKGIEGLRSSLVLSAADDSRLSLLEILQKYPAQRVEIDARKINKTYGQVEFLVEGAEKALQFVRETVGDIIC
ncbi:alpha/beta hydrolase [Laspinema sp. D1]|uniref:Alpha/beta hydrolase n=1 Tax=Laspinema palackyanum D2a TaxID=2953684 RepID=A0ABT2N1N2_9CYAN|nr:alpha/beta hydrolase [Laspinema sp. D2b]MCT7970125.1 alpha/beta hydrolase [Laspinema sp. D2a]